MAFRLISRGRCRNLFLLRSWWRGLLGAFLAWRVATPWPCGVGRACNRLSGPWMGLP